MLHVNWNIFDQIQRVAFHLRALKIAWIAYWLGRRPVFLAKQILRNSYAGSSVKFNSLDKPSQQLPWNEIAMNILSLVRWIATKTFSWVAHYATLRNIGFLFFFGSLYIIVKLWAIEIMSVGAISAPKCVKYMTNKTKGCERGKTIHTQFACVCLCVWFMRIDVRKSARDCLCTKISRY